MIYHVHPEQVRLSKRIARAMLVLAVTLLGAFLVHHFWSSRSSWDVWEDLFDALVAFVAFFFFDSRRRGYQIEVTEQTIAMRGDQRFWGTRRVRRGHIRYFHEQQGNFFRESMLRLSEHGGFYRSLFGNVLIPTSLPQYEQIKMQAMSWRQIA